MRAGDESAYDAPSPCSDYSGRRYGHTVYVSIPVFKLCGHFVLIVDEHKYELRLDSSTRHRPIFSERPLHPGEAEKIRSSFGHHWFVVGWTHRQHRDIQAIFNGVMNEFGLYDRIHNNCRHFLQVGCYTILDATAVWHEDMLLVSPATFWFLPKMSIMLWRAMLREFFRWACAYLWGPGKCTSTYRFLNMRIHKRDRLGVERVLAVFDLLRRLVGP